VTSQYSMVTNHDTVSVLCGMMSYVATLPCDLSLITVYVSGCRCFSGINISQGSAATRLTDGGIFYYCFTTNLLLSLS